MSGHDDKPYNNYDHHGYKINEPDASRIKIRLASGFINYFKLSIAPALSALPKTELPATSTSHPDAAASFAVSEFIPPSISRRQDGLPSSRIPLISFHFSKTSAINF